jgi:DNA-binding CsgD family transcriptional regulator
MGGDQNLRRTAEEMGMSYWTARVHLKNILEKTGTHSQSQLSRLLSRLE